MMKNKIFFLLPVIVLAAIQILPTGTQQSRRIEEEKRKSLRPTEQKVIHEKKEPFPQEQIDETYFKDLLTRKVIQN